MCPPRERSRLPRMMMRRPRVRTPPQTSRTQLRTVIASHRRLRSPRGAMKTRNQQLIRALERIGKRRHSLRASGLSVIASREWGKTRREPGRVRIENRLGPLDHESRRKARSRANTKTNTARCRHCASWTGNELREPFLVYLSHRRSGLTAPLPPSPHPPRSFPRRSS
jgi:hypothetical protein